MAGVIDRFRGWNRRRIATRRATRKAQPTPFGFDMNGTNDMISGRFEPEETALVRTLLNRCDRFVNVGANTGYYCLFARRLGRPVTALEPVPSTAAMLLRNLADNGLDEGATVLPVAAGASPGAARIYGVGTGSSLLRGWANNPESTSQLVPVVRLDDVVAAPGPEERLLILMDVEGFEYPALLGSTKLIEAPLKPVWMIEIAPDGAGGSRSSHVTETFALMFGAGYVARRADTSLAIVDGAVSGVTNYIFHAAGLTEEDVFGPAGERVEIHGRKG